jgi:polysaccharide export outer membrane protein
MLSFAHAQESAKDSDTTKAEQQVHEYQLGPGDLLSIHVFSVKEINQSTRVSNSGRVHVPYIGIISVANMTTGLLEREIVKRLNEQQFVKDPWVRVRVEEYRSQPVFAMGEFNHAGQYVISSEMHLLDLVSKAGGLRRTASSEGFLYRRRDPSQPTVEVRIGPTDQGTGARSSSSPPTPEVSNTNSDRPAEESVADKAIPINFKELIDGKRPELNLQLRGGDTIYVSRRRPENFFVVGEVNWPGVYTLPQEREHVTATRAVTYAGGPTITAKRKGFIIRHDETGGIQELAFDFGAIIKGEKPDIPIRPNDIILVPNSNLKTIGNALLVMMPRLVQQFLIF